MDVRGLGSLALSAGFRTQSDLKTLTQRLSSGLRINTAADDPSGLAIAESLASKVNGLDEGVRQIQNATNALQVAEGAMSSISSLLQRMRALVVQARSDLASTADKNNIQTELDQLRLEIDKISSNTNFNGRNLLDGSASSVPPQPARIIIETNAPTSSGSGLILDTTFDPTEPATTPNAPQLVQLLTIDSYDPTSGNLTITATIESPDPNFGPNQVASVQVANGTNYDVFGTPPIAGVQAAFTQTDQYGNPVLSFNIGVLTPGDVGKSSLLITLPAQQKVQGSAIHVETGSQEGSILSVDIPGMSSVNLGVNQVILGDDLQNQANEYRIDYAIQQLASARASVGAQTVALQEAGNIGNVTSVNTQASESMIRDVNIGQSATQLVRDQVLVQFQNKLVADAQQLSRNYATLVSDSIVFR